MNDTNEKIINQLKQIIAEELDVNINVEDIDENASLFEDGIGLDSVVIVELITLIEKHFDFQLSEDELNMELFQNLRTIARGISAHHSTVF